MNLIIISGRSGSGKSICLRLLEDLGFYCVDNLPLDLLPSLCQQISTQQDHVAVSVDARSSSTSDLTRFDGILSDLKKMQYNPLVIYLDANSDTLLQRYSETRRKHPLTTSWIALKEAIESERRLLSPIANAADLIIDTTGLTGPQLGKLLRERITSLQTNGLSILIQSFGYKYGIPADADFVFDARCLPNPYWQPNLRDLTGLDAAVIEFLQQQPSVQAMQQDITDFLDKWIPYFIADKRSYLTVAIGCTGGQHRSVYLVNHMAQKYRSVYPTILVRHRELEKNI